MLNHSRGDYSQWVLPQVGQNCSLKLVRASQLLFLPAFSRKTKPRVLRVVVYFKLSGRNVVAGIVFSLGDVCRRGRNG